MDGGFRLSDRCEVRSFWELSKSRILFAKKTPCNFGDPWKTVGLDMREWTALSMSLDKIHQKIRSILEKPHEIHPTGYFNLSRDTAVFVVLSKWMDTAGGLFDGEFQNYQPSVVIRHIYEDACGNIRPTTRSGVTLTSDEFESLLKLKPTITNHLMENETKKFAVDEKSSVPKLQRKVGKRISEFMQTGRPGKRLVMVVNYMGPDLLSSSTVDSCCHYSNVNIPDVISPPSEKKQRRNNPFTTAGEDSSDDNGVISASTNSGSAPSSDDGVDKNGGGRDGRDIVESAILESMAKETEEALGLLRTTDENQRGYDEPDKH